PAGPGALFFSPVLTGRVHLETDWLTWFYPWRAQATEDPHACLLLENRLLQDPVMIYTPQDRLYNESLKRGELLLWDPTAFAGHPYQAIGHPSVLYPPRILAHLLLPSLAAREVLLFLHLYLNGLFMYAFLRSLARSRFAS